MERRQSTFVSQFRNSFLILFWEFLGSVFLGMFQRMLSSVEFILAYWVLVAMCANISGSHFNPAVTVAFIFRRNTGKFSRCLGLAYIVCQFGGIFCGALLAFLFTESGGSLSIRDDDAVFQAMLIEAVATFLYVFTFLIQTEETTRFSRDAAIWALIVASSYGTAISFSASTSGGAINPAYGFSVCFTGLLDTGKGRELKWIWIYLIFPTLGGIVAVLFHEFIYTKTLKLIDEGDQAPPKVSGNLDDTKTEELIQ